MIVKATPPRMSPEQFEEWSGNNGLELIDGIVKEKNMGAESSSVNARVGIHLGHFVLTNGLCEVFDSETMYRCFPSHPRRVRKPDFSLIRHDRLPDGHVPKGILTIRPDLAVEVISPNDSYDDLDEKIADYFDAGIPLIWVVSPQTRTVLVYHADGMARRLRETEDLTADPVISGFHVRILDLFPNPPEARQVAEPEGTPN
jgi:Uma2 family endonuclease